MKMREARGKEYIRYDVFFTDGSQYFIETGENYNEPFDTSRLIEPLKALVLSKGVKVKGRIPKKHLKRETDDSYFKLPNMPLAIKVINV